MNNKGYLKFCGICFSILFLCNWNISKAQTSYDNTYIKEIVKKQSVTSPFDTSKYNIYGKDTIHISPTLIEDEYVEIIPLDSFVNNKRLRAFYKNDSNLTAVDMFYFNGSLIKMISYWKNGCKKEIINFRNKKRVDDYFRYHANCKIKKKAKYKNGVLDGKLVFYNEDGKVDFFEKYRNGVRIKQVIKRHVNSGKSELMK